MNTPIFKAKPIQISEWLSGQKLEDICRQFEDDGYYLFDQILKNDEIQDLRDELSPYLDANISGRNEFEGQKSNRIYAMLNKSPLFAELVTHPLALGFAEAELGESCLLSACLAIQLNPGETQQPWHYDDAHLEIPRPRPAYGLSVFWAIDETTEINGATELIRGSHKWSEQYIEGSLDQADMNKTKSAKDDRSQLPVKDSAKSVDEAVKVVMQPGSMMIAKGTLWHRGGANLSDQPRLIITPQYCPGWSRQLENMLLAVTPENAAKLPQRAQELIGYNIHPPFMGYVDGMHPQRILGT